MTVTVIDARAIDEARLSLSGSVGYVDSVYRHLFNGTEDLAGNRVKLVPRYDANLTARYQPPPRRLCSEQP